MPQTAAPDWRKRDVDLLLADFERRHGYRPDPERGASYTDGLLRLMGSDEAMHPLRQFVTDKEYAKVFVAAVAGEKYNVRPYAILRDEAGIRRYAFPERCVVKPTHSSGAVVVRRAGEPVDLDRVCGWLKDDYYPRSLECVYRFLEPKIIVEELVEEPGRQVPTDYKIFCFRGRPAFMHVDLERGVNHTRAFYTPRWERMPFFTGACPEHVGEIPRPAHLDEMMRLAARLSAPFSFLRVDLYHLPGGPRVGELTNFPGGSRQPFKPRADDERLGRLFREPATDALSLFPGASPGGA